jgi:hypothetical protein
MALDLNRSDLEVAADVKAFLIKVQARSISTKVLASWLGPGGAIKSRLLKLADVELADCVSRGMPERRRMYGKMRQITPRLWSAPRRVASDVKTTEASIDFVPLG